MNVSCEDRERIFENGTEAEWAALEAHAASCTHCARELRAWESLSVAAQGLRNYSESPVLWARIKRALAEEAAKEKQPGEWKSWFLFRQKVPLGWQTALAGVLVLALAVSAVWVHWAGMRSPVKTDQSLLRSKALKEVERAETAYIQAIDKLAVEARPQLDNPATPLLANYQEKLQVLDSAIDDLQAQTGLNPSNAQLRYQLLAMYREKRQTLEEVLEAKQQ